jgi:hypothetical protein
MSLRPVKWISFGGAPTVTVPAEIARRVLVCILALALLPLIMFLQVTAVHNGGVGLEDADVAGCHCHNVAPDPGVTLNLMGVPERYVPGEVYELTITAAGGPAVTEVALNSGGFMVTCTNGSFEVPEGSDLVQIFNDDQSASHTMAGNDFRQWRLIWRAPAEGTGDAVFYMSANTVNGDGVETGELDAYNQLLTISFGAPVDEAPEDDVSEWGVSLSAYWLGTIGFVAVLVLTWGAFYIIRGTSRHQVVHIGTRRRYKVEERTPPTSFGAVVIIVVLTIVEVVATVVLVDNLNEGASGVGVAVNLAVVLVLFVFILAVYRSAFIPSLVSIEPEAASKRPGGPP